MAQTERCVLLLVAGACAPVAKAAPGEIALGAASRFIALSVDVTQLGEIPPGSHIDARRGRVALTAEVDATTGRTQSAEFYAGVAQTKGFKPTLAGSVYLATAP